MYPLYLSSFMYRKKITLDSTSKFAFWPCSLCLTLVKGFLFCTYSFFGIQASPEFKKLQIHLYSASPIYQNVFPGLSDVILITGLFLCLYNWNVTLRPFETVDTRRYHMFIRIWLSLFISGVFLGVCYFKPFQSYFLLPEVQEFQYFQSFKVRGMCAGLSCFWFLFEYPLVLAWGNIFVIYYRRNLIIVNAQRNWPFPADWPITAAPRLCGLFS